MQFTGSESIELQEGSEDPIQGWSSHRYGQKMASSAVLVRGEATLATGFATLLVPSGAMQSTAPLPPVPALAASPLPGGGLSLVVQGDFGQDLVIWPSPEGGDWSTGEVRGGDKTKVALIRTDPSGTVRRVFVLGESIFRDGVELAARGK